MEQLRESFVFHFEYIEDIPEELQAQYAMYAIKYAQYGIEPELTDWRDVRMWNKTKNRIDSETQLWEETKQKRAEAGRKGGQAKKSNDSNAKQNEAMLSNAKQDEANQAVYVSVSDNVNVNDSVCVSVAQESAPENTPTFPTTSIDTWFESKNLKLTTSQRSQIYSRLLKLDFRSDKSACPFLDFAYDFVKNKYPDVSAVLFASAVCTWNNIVDDYKANLSPYEHIKKRKPAVKGPEECPACKSRKMSWISNSLYFCSDCRKDIKLNEGKWEAV